MLITAVYIISAGVNEKSYTIFSLTDQFKHGYHDF